MESRAVPEPHVLVAAVGAIRAGRGGWGDTSARIDDCSRQVSRERLLRHPLATWQRLAALVDGSTGRFGEQLCSNRKRCGDGLACTRSPYGRSPSRPPPHEH